MIRKYINRSIIALPTVKLESSIGIGQLILNKKDSYEAYQYQGYSPVLTFTINTNNGKFSDRIIKITDRSYFRFMKVLKKSIDWFYDESKRDMFAMTDDGDLVFNHDYDKLSEVYYDPFNSNCFLKIIPTAVQDRNGKMIEGVNIYINKLDTITSVYRSDLEDIANVLDRFSFQEETILLMKAYSCALEANGGAVNPGFYLQQQKLDKSLRAVPISAIVNKPKNIFGL